MANYTCNYVCNLKQIRKEDVAIAGGKAANLGEMIGSGLPVPGGFVVLTNAYKRFVEANQLQKEIVRLFSNIDGTNTEELNEATNEIKQLFEQGEIPEDIKAEIDRIYEQQGNPTVAIRSSATAEDMPGMSFAGQYSTYLNVKGKEEVYIYIKKCWASLWNERAVAYRIKQNIGNNNLAHGVVVQKLVNAEKSGIMFTANPVNGVRDEVLINSSWGLGEAIVAGEVNPDQWIISKKTGSVVQEEVATKKVQTIRKAKGIELIEVDSEQQKVATLNDTEKQVLLELAIQVENYYNFPQDLEWACEDGEFYLVQTRPITTLYPIPDNADADDFRVYLNLYMYSQSMKEPFTPMGFEIARFGFQGMMTKFGKKHYKGNRLWWLHNLGGRVYADITSIMKSEKMQANLRDSKRNDKDPLTTKALLQVLENNKQALVNSKIDAFSMMSIINMGLLKIAVDGVFKSIYGTINPAEARARAKQTADQTMERIRMQMKSCKTVEQKLKLIEEISDAGVMGSLEILLYGGKSLTYLSKAEGIMTKYLDDISDLQHVEKAVPYNITTEMGMELLYIAKELDGHGRRATAKEPRIINFLDKYGDKNSFIELEVASTTWREDPQFVIDTINSYIDLQNYNQEIDRFYKGQEEAEQAIIRIKAKLEQKAGKRVARKVEKILRNYREMFGLRELPKYYMSMGLSMISAVLIEIGEHLEKAGRIKDRMDVFYVTVEDIKSKKKLLDIVEKNKEEYQRELARPMPPRLLISTGESVYSAVETAGDNAYVGVPVSPGVYEGRVKVLKNPLEGNKLEKGDILVTSATNPAWTPLFLKIGALIMETGGPISHGSVVAREYGIPAVVGVVAATSELKDGQIVRVNGETGSVEKII
ncbi:PEP/pyruvate-binding domain-containing protein [Desulfuribacillus alkaliarsenatis]|uniref:Phosphoenolpyruvate synthase n=1 Tax=Desulfuribacillus alkaliarsenatis TaxID=766136 RepID=A0A1E5G2D3_9FIRM|nr:PEP/pyruvate-binding domain-containing protein [Desulfuribacillus alkaliarsenatis]OEF97135.1 hypothetical protein BHF68_05940 [Desulfuribacillus alkaliarsenatis]